MFDSTLQPAVPVHAMRLWDSNTQWCQMDRGTSTDEYDFTQLDLLLAQADRLSADVEYTFGYTPRWAADGLYPQPGARTSARHRPTHRPPRMSRRGRAS